ncbi:MULTISPECIES: MerR family transcriptional regulator [Burkholderia cepacia complex]|uniref:MerR family transcriptional regulator n=1 Tax=Burkholderia cepacia complex TaxID=87882 RepID=UPI00064B90C8|nr:MULTISPECIES: MerR family transcriptional regulator [Burkholderia cepacia complex]AKM01452.1 MerR family transcriptional regulator [Burkholderia pyrrocinia]GAU01512.1 MerR family transcriptional regulator [Burkholderia stabilis]
MSKTVSKPSAAGPLTIGQVAELTGMSTHTLRYYEQAGLLRAISRTAAGHRLYAPADLDWLAFVMRLKATGMPIAQMQEFAALREQGEPTFGARRRLLVTHRDAVRAHLAELQASLDAIGDKIAYYEARERETERRAIPSHSQSEQDGHDGTTR